MALNSAGTLPATGVLCCDREDYRKHSFVSEAATGIISGFGAHGYILALDAAAKLVG